MERGCLWCGEPMKGQRSDAVYCNAGCRRAASRAGALRGHSGAQSARQDRPGPEPRPRARSAA